MNQLSRRPPEYRRAAALEPEPTTLTERAWRMLEEEIVTLRLAPGSVVSEAGLSAHLGLGRTPVREALQRLAREHLVQILPRRGVIVTEIDVGAQVRMLEVRRELERLLARLAGRRARPPQRRRFEAIADGMEAAATRDDGVAFMRFDRSFNLLLLDAADNEFAAAAMSVMNGLSRRFWYMHHRRAANLALTARLHADVARAVAAALPDEAAAASDRLLDYIQDVVRKTIE